MPMARFGSSTTDQLRAELLDLAAAMITVVLVFLVLTGWTGAPRLLCTVLFTFFAPGRAVVSNWPRIALWADLAMSIAFSLGSLALLALITLWLRAWRPESLFLSEALLSLAGLGSGIVRRRKAIWK